MGIYRVKILPIVSIVVPFLVKDNQNLYYRILIIKLVNQKKELQWILYVAFGFMGSGVQDSDFRAPNIARGQLISLCTYGPWVSPRIQVSHPVGTKLLAFSRGLSCWYFKGLRSVCLCGCVCS